MNSTHAIAAAALLVVFALAAGPAAARQWQATSTSQAVDYSQIVDQRSSSEIALIIWLTPEMIENNAQNAAGRQALGAYVIIGVVHANVSNEGIFTFSPPGEVLVSTGDGAARRPLAENAISPITAGILAALQSMMVQALGPMGEGMHWFAFSSEGIRSCGKGEFWVAFADENYNYETPIPGCPEL